MRLGSELTANLSVVDRAVNAEARATLYDEELAYRRKQDTHKGREIGTKKITIFKKATDTKDNNNLLKVRKSFYIVTHLGQVPFMLFKQKWSELGLSKGTV